MNKGVIFAYMQFQSSVHFFGVLWMKYLASLPEASRLSGNDIIPSYSCCGKCMRQTETDQWLSFLLTDRRLSVVSIERNARKQRNERS